MTANSSPRLGLMLPTNLDPFVPDDFVATFGVLDSKPGLTLVANYAGLPTNLTAAQHGSPYLQLDNGAEWYWYRPSNGAPGVWKRLNSLGVLGQALQGGTVSTTTQNLNAAPTLVTLTLSNLAGGRWLMATVETAPTGTNGLAQINFWINGVVKKGWFVYTNKANHFANTYTVLIAPPTPGSNMTVRASLCAALVPTSYGGGGTVNATGGSITVTEV